MKIIKQHFKSSSKTFFFYNTNKNSSIKRIKNFRLFFNFKKLKGKLLTLHPKQFFISIIIYYLKKIVVFLKKKEKFSKNILELQILLKNYSHLIKNGVFSKFKILIKKTLFILLKLKQTVKIYSLKIIINKLFLFYIKNGYNLNSSSNLFALKRNIKYKKKNSNNDIFNKFVGLITKKGEKIKAKKIFLNTLLKVRKELKLSINIILLKIFIFLKTSVESKKIRVRRTFHLVPFPINKNRKTFLVAKWILFPIKNSNNKTVVEKLSSEIIKLLKGLKSSAKKNKKYNIVKSLQNKSNLHFRW